MQTADRYELVHIDKLVPYARNARTHGREQILQLRASLREFGFVNPVIVDKALNIIAGHGRIMAARDEGYKEIPCIFMEHLTETQKQAYILADNRLAENAGWDEEILALELADLRDFGFDIEVTGFDYSDLERALAADDSDDEPDEAQEDNFNADEAVAAIENPTTVQGDIWQLGKHQLMCGDSTNADAVQILMGKTKARCVFTDPPWNVDYDKSKIIKGRKSRPISNDNMGDKFHDFLYTAFKNMSEAAEAGCMVYVVMNCQEWENFMNALRDTGFHWSSTIIWAKDSFVVSRKDYHPQYEPIWYGWLEEKRLYPLKDRKQSDIWKIPRPKASPEHPTMKPVALVGKAIQNSSRKGDIVMDLFGGSGTTLVAAEQTGRVCRMMELDPKYCDVIVRRYVALVEAADSVFLLRDGKKIPYSEVGL